MLPPCQKYKRPPPIRIPAPTCSHIPYARLGPSSTTRAAPSRQSPTKSVTIADQPPPFETRSVMKYQPVPITAVSRSGKRNTRSAHTAAINASSTSKSRLRWKPSSASWDDATDQPNHDQSAPRNATNAISATNANTPAETGCAVRRNVRATAVATTASPSAAAANPASLQREAKYAHHPSSAITAVKPDA